MSTNVQEKEQPQDITKIDVKNAKEVKKQKVSISYTLKSFSNNITKLEDEKIITKEEGTVLKEIRDKAVKHWIGLEFNF